jgi:hypothetical protein
MNQLIDAIGWIASLLIVGAYFLNITGKLSAQSYTYIALNFIGGFFFIINTWHHGAYPSALVNVIWVVIAVFSLFRRIKRRTAVD